MRLYKLTLLILAFNIEQSLAQVCTTGEGESGVCQLQCDSLSNNLPLTLCPTNGIGPLVCCPSNDENRIPQLPSISPSRNNSQCGVSPVSATPLIVGGQEARPNSWPWAVGVYQSGRYICGGTLISERYVLTAAHCVVRSTGTLPANSFKVQLGSHDIRNSGFYVNVAQVKAHQRYSSNGHSNDIALFKLSEPINFSQRQNVGTICLPTSDMENQPSRGTMVTLIGWGTTQEGGRPSNVLRQVNVPVVDTNECARAYSGMAGGPVGRSQICAAYPQGGKDSCQGDSGGSMQYVNPSTKAWTQLGVVSFGRGCAQPGYPGVYTRVASFRQWIDSNTQD